MLASFSLIPPHSVACLSPGWVIAVHRSHRQLPWPTRELHTVWHQRRFVAQVGDNNIIERLAEVNVPKADKGAGFLLCITCFFRSCTRRWDVHIPVKGEKTCMDQQRRGRV